MKLQRFITWAYRWITWIAPKISTPRFSAWNISAESARNPNNPDSFPIHGVAQKLDRFRCGSDDVWCCSERPKADPSATRSTKTVSFIRPSIWRGKITTTP